MKEAFDSRDGKEYYMFRGSRVTLLSFAALHNHRDITTHMILVLVLPQLRYYGYKSALDTTSQYGKVI